MAEVLQAQHQQQQPEPVEAPEPQDIEDESDAVSLSGTSVQTDTDSLKSSIRDYRRENGRTYHSVSDGNFQHHCWQLTWDGKLCMCPKKDGANRVLDIGTGTGIWAMDYADAHPEAVVIGVDLSPIQPEYVPPNCRFEIDDVDKEWTWQEPFDFIFARHMNACFASWEKFLKQAYDNLEPGGYIELQDNAFPILCGDGTLKPDDPMARWSTLMMEGTELIGRPITVPAAFRRLLQEAGFEDVVEHKRVWPTSPWPKDEALRELGLWTQACSLEGVEPGALALFTRVLGWTREEVLVFIASVRKDFKNKNIHAYWNAYSVYGRKPLKDATPPAPSPS
ncbi:methyltransferase domain-containing protein [Colletotrichum graminicola M1.001]|uniref:Methyltransferase domain-containing protein n=1 Tax=Colletotrichum graminicola (strain M1.001 / M2 / FGSC 10212) TaxID=645133 RepID=E3Q4P2_COLGM|nr:methyltransferase domain-containing protein [Colletotrichum graminicola M1.001]EFQ26057.1 methyltransferase domain-containing protein [Colletotrichum graminicola M1.001]